MRLACLSHDNVLCGKLKNNLLFRTVSMVDNLTDLDSKYDDYDVIILSDRIVSYEKLPEFTSCFANVATFYMVSSNPDYKLFQKIETMCHAHDVHIVYPKQTQDQIISFVVSVLKPIEAVPKNHVTAFVGSQSKVGVTTTVMAAASRLGMSTEAKIGVLGLNAQNPGTVYMRGYQGTYLDELKTLLSNNMLSTSQLMKEMYEFNHFFYLAGNRDIKKRLHYSIREIHYLIEQSKKIYDLILIDAGSNYDDALCIQGLLNSDTKFLVTNQQLSGLFAWNSAYDQVLEPTGFTKQDFLMIINQYQSKPQLPDVKQLVHDYGVPCLRHIGDVGDLGPIVEADRNLIIDYEEPEYKKDIDFIVKALIKTYKLTCRDQKAVKRTGLLQRLFG